MDDAEFEAKIEHAQMAGALAAKARPLLALISNLEKAVEQGAPIVSMTVQLAEGPFEVLEFGAADAENSGVGIAQALLTYRAQLDALKAALEA